MGMTAYTNPGNPQILTPANPTCVPFQLQPTDKSAVLSLWAPPGGYTGAAIFIESSVDNGATQPWSPMPALREASIIGDTCDVMTPIALLNGQTYNWRVDGLIPGTYLRVRCGAPTGLGSVGIGTLATGSLSIAWRSGAFFLDSPPVVQIPVGAFSTVALQNQNTALLFINYLQLAYLYAILTATNPAALPNFNLADKFLNQFDPGLVAQFQQYLP